MQTKTILLVSVLLLEVCGIASLHAQNPPQPLPAPAHHDATPASASLIAGYKSWKRVNAKPHPVTSRIALLCRAPTQAEIDAEATDPHLEAVDHPSIMRMRYVVVYVNQTAEQAMLHEKRPAYPEGSLLVKERLADPKSSVPELITVMHKREKGYNPKGGDWEYLTLDGAAKQVQSDGRLQKCQSCHSEWKHTDYTSRAYLSDDITRKFR
jgi:Cytochrome P460